MPSQFPSAVIWQLVSSQNERVNGTGRLRLRDLPRKRKLMFVAGIAIALCGIVVGIGGLVRNAMWDSTVSHADCTVTGVTGPDLYGKSQHKWLVETTDCGLLTITVGNPGHPFSAGKSLAAELSGLGRYRLTLHGWGDHRDVAAPVPDPKPGAAAN